MSKLFSKKKKTIPGFIMYKLQKNIHRKPIQKFEMKNEKLNQSRKNNRHLCLIYGSLEIPCNVTAKLPAIIKNHIRMDRYKELLGEVYYEPKNEELHFHLSS